MLRASPVRLRFLVGLLAITLVSAFMARTPLLHVPGYEAGLLVAALTPWKNLIATAGNIDHVGTGRAESYNSQL